MCGPENTNRPRGGALAALNRPFDNGQFPRSSLAGDLTFHTPGSPDSLEATHVRLTPEAASAVNNLPDLRVVIHNTGDLTKQAHECGLFRDFRLSKQATPSSEGYLELPLERPLLLEIGNHGIIGRRVSVCADYQTERQAIIAEGIVGFNAMVSTRPSL